MHSTPERMAHNLKRLCAILFGGYGQMESRQPEADLQEVAQIRESAMCRNVLTMEETLLDRQKGKMALCRQLVQPCC